MKTTRKPRAKRANQSGGRVIAKGPWRILSDAPKVATDLHFVKLGPLRPEYGDRLIESWWNVSPAATNYWHVHECLGRAYAFDLIDALRNPDGSIVPSQAGTLLTDMLRWARHGGHSWGDIEGIAHGFGEVLGEYIQWHTARR